MNVLLAENGTVKIADFGLAHLVETMRATLSSKGITGSLAWKAPETFGGRYSQKSDCYSFAVVCFEVMTWSVPWNEHTQAEITKKVCEHFDPQAMFVQRLVKGSISIDELRAEWLEAHPLSERRP